MIKNRKMDAAKPSYQAAIGKSSSLRWDDHFVEEVKRALVACKVFCFYPIYWVIYGQFSGNFVTQGKHNPTPFSDRNRFSHFLYSWRDARTWNSE